MAVRNKFKYGLLAFLVSAALTGCGLDGDDGDAIDGGGNVDDPPTASIVGKPKQYGGWGPTRGCCQK